MKRIGTVVDSAGVSNLNAAAAADPLTVVLPNLGNLASTIHTLVQQGLTAEAAAERIATWVDPQLVPALQMLAKILGMVNKYVPGAEGASAAEHGGE
jgi:hypothetical protein